MRELVLTHRFKKSFAKYIKKYPNQKLKVYKTLGLMKEDIWSSNLAAHKLSGNLFGLRACSSGVNCRIIFSIENKDNNEFILLIDIGTHEDIY